MNQVSFKQLVKDKFSQLSPGQKKVATFMIDNLEECSFHTAFQIGKKAEVSETTVIRLSYALEFEGFTDMQLCIQKQFLQQNKDTSYGNRKESSREKENSFQKIIEKEVSLLRNLLEPTNIEEIWKTVDKLIQADHVLIVGHRISHVAAYWFTNMLSTLRGNVHFCSQSGDFYEKFCNLTEQSAVVAFSFPRYAKETFTIAECTKEHGISLISVTDRLLSPVGRISDIVLTTEENVESGSNSIASVISLLELVIAGMYEKDQKQIQSYQRKLEKLYTNFGLFIE